LVIPHCFFIRFFFGTGGSEVTSGAGTVSSHSRPSSTSVAVGSFDGCHSTAASSIVSALLLVVN